MEIPGRCQKERFQIFRVYAREMGLFKGRIIMWLAAVIIALIPTIYTTIYILSMWDPYHRASEIPAGIVCLDKGIEFKGKFYNLGNEVIKKLKQTPSFRLIEYGTYEAAERGVRRGDDYFALYIPPDFSELAIPGNHVAKLQIITSSGTNIVSTLMAERFVQIIAKNLNQKLAVERWRNVISKGRQAHEGTEKLKNGAEEALAGSEKLKEGIDKADGGAVKLAEKGKELHGATQKLASGIAGHGLTGGLVGLPSDQDMKRLAEGAKLYQNKIEELAGGLGQLKTGSSKLTDGIQQIHKGLSQFSKALDVEELKADALAISVQAEEKELTPVYTNGEAYCPYFMCLSIWLAGVMSAFLFHLIIFPVSMEHKTKTAKIIGKGMAPTTILLIGSIILGLVVQFVLKVPVINPFGYYATLVVAVIVFNSLILSFVKMIGDAGKLIAVLFLIIQLSSSGGVYPIQTSPAFYRFLYPYLPLTHVLNALRAAMFGSYEGDWVRFLIFLIPWLALSFAFAFFSADRYKYVPDNQYGPALTLSFKKQGPEMRATNESSIPD